MSIPFQLGSFKHHLGLLSFNETAKGRAAQAALAAGKPVAFEVREDIEVAFEVGSLPHELQHFFDVFGTAAGTSLISSGLHWVKKFALLCDYAKLRRAQDPSWKGDAGWLEGRREILRGFRFALAAEKMFSRPFDPVELDGPGDDLFTAVHHPFDGATCRGIIDGNRGTFVEPLGFEALIETNAHAHVRSVIDQGFPALKFQGQLRTKIFNQNENLGGLSTPYMTVDILLSRWFRDRGINEFPRKLVHDLIDRALGSASFTFGDVAGYGVVVPMRPVGMVLREILSKLDPNAVLNERIPRDLEVDRFYRMRSDSYDAGADWDTVEGTYFDHGVRVWETWIAKHVTAPLLRRRAEGSGSLIDRPGAITAISELVPIIVKNDRIVAMNMPDPVKQAWFKVAFLTSVLHQLTAQGTASCPRRFALYPGLTSVPNFARKRTCDFNADFGCGSTAGALTDGEFDCLFEDVVGAMGARQMA